MTKNVGIVTVPHEYIVDNKITPEDLKHRLLLPDGVSVYKTYEDWYRQTFNLMLISKEPVHDTTYPTCPGCEVPFSAYEFKGNYILVGDRRR